MALFTLGIFVGLITALLGILIIATVETRIKEKEQWDLVQSQSSPSQTYWSSQAQPETSDDEVLRVINPRSQTPGQP